MLSDIADRPVLEMVFVSKLELISDAVLPQTHSTVYNQVSTIHTSVQNDLI